MRNDTWFKAGGLSLASLMLFGCADVDVSGVIRDETTQRPIEGATVRIGDASTVTDSSGFYSMEVDSDDDDAQRFSVQAPGYEAVSDVRLIDDDVDPARIDFDLQADPASRRGRVQSQQQADQNRASTPAPVDVNIRAQSDAQSGDKPPVHDEGSFDGKIEKPESRTNTGGAVDTNPNKR